MAYGAIVVKALVGSLQRAWTTPQCVGDTKTGDERMAHKALSMPMRLEKLVQR